MKAFSQRCRPAAVPLPVWLVTKQSPSRAGHSDLGSPSIYYRDAEDLLGPGSATVPPRWVYCWLSAFAPEWGLAANGP